jgi:uncharacterized membrane protein
MSTTRLEAFSDGVLAIIITIMSEGRDSVLARAVGTDLKGKLSPLFCLVAIPVAFVYPGISEALFVAAALVWLIPDRRIERVIEGAREGPTPTLPT